MTSQFKNKRVAVTGAAGTVGGELVRQLLKAGAEEVRALDHSETLLWAFEKDNPHKRIACYMADVQNVQHLSTFFEGVDHVFHCAAYKHVPLCETHPQAAIGTNILGVQNVITAARNAGVERVLFTSSDKAVNPTNVMGTSKLMGERLITAANALNLGPKKPIFASTRFGNVAGSSGSVIKIFEEQIMKGGPITLTERGMTRFMMTLEESVRLVIDSLVEAQGGEVFVTKMPVIKISDLAEVMIEELAPKYGHKPEKIEIKVTGARPGEKLYEELTTDEEIKRTIEVDDKFVVLPAWRNLYTSVDFSVHQKRGKPADRVYNSDLEPAVGKDEVLALLRKLV
jgi:FlaA1/EpsC-like NDP-sugar epimerase